MDSRMNSRIPLVIILNTLLFSSFAYAQWEPQRSADGNWLYVFRSYNYDPDKVSLDPNDYDLKNVLAVVGYLGSAQNVQIPPQIDGYPVKAIDTWDDSSFLENAQNIIIPDSVEIIGRYALAYSALSNVVIPHSVKSISGGAFEYSKNLTEVSIGSGVQYVGWGGDVFEGCDSLLNINVSPENRYFSSRDGVFFNTQGNRLISVPPMKKGHYFVPTGTTSIAGNAFRGCQFLTSVTIPESVEDIGKRSTLGVGVFEDCSSIIAVSVPSRFLGSIPGWSLPNEVATEAMITAIADKILRAAPNNYGIATKADLQNLPVGQPGPAGPARPARPQGRQGRSGGGRAARARGPTRCDRTTRPGGRSCRTKG